ncbi:MAG: pyruvate kinase [Holosporales bacterium]|nr:pyruvate kinase [Holosporales bacterium]
MKNSRCTKIVATLGPSSNSKKMILELCAGGVDVFRLNFSHGSYEDHQAAICSIREAEKAVNRPLAIMLDLQGPKIRIGTFQESPVPLKCGQKFQLDSDPTPGTNERVYFRHKEIFQSLKVGTSILMDDGKVLLQVDELFDDRIVGTIINGKEIADRKGVNIPDVLLSVGAMTPKDEKDLSFGLLCGIDWVAVSFVQHADDILAVRQRVPQWMKIIAKIEKPAAIMNLDGIINAADGVMVARGDLGVEVPLEQVPGLQKRILRECHFLGKPVIVATQMLDSMIASPMPTRAEVSDVANAVFDGADAVMLSAETASGQYPAEAVQIMDRIINQVEKEPLYLDNIKSSTNFNANICSPITFSIPKMVESSNIKAIATISTSGRTAAMISRERPKARIIAISPNEHTARYLSLIWGVQSLFSEIGNFANFDELSAFIQKTLLEMGSADNGDEILIVSGAPYNANAGINILQILTL